MLARNLPGLILLALALSAGCGGEIIEPTPNPTDSESDVAVTVAGPQTAAPGTTIDYLITVTNAAGAAPAVDVIVTDTLPEGVSVITASHNGTEASGVLTWPPIMAMAAGESATRTITAMVIEEGNLRNVAAATTSTPDSHPDNNNGTGSGRLLTVSVAPPVVVPDTVQGIVMTGIVDLVDRIRGGAYAGVHSLLIQRNGEAVLEEYFQSSSATELHTLQSVTKSFTSALIGIAIDRGHIESVDERVVDFFPQWRDQLSQDPRRAAMTVEDILTMRTGTDYHERGLDSPHAELNRLPSGWDRFWLDRPMVNAPGTFWQYDSGGVVTLSSMLKQRTGLHADEYADQYLFGPLGITRSRWAKNEEGHPHSAGGLFLTAPDMMKFGQLFLQRGRWGDEQLVPEAWVDASIRRRETFATPRGTAGKTEAYGYLWWLLAPDPAGMGSVDIYAASGYRAQYIFVVPEHDMVVVVTGWIEPAAQGGPIEFLYSDILPAVVH